MTTTKYNDEIIPQLTYGKAAAAIASRLLQTHGLPDNSRHIHRRANLQQAGLLLQTS